MQIKLATVLIALSLLLFSCVINNEEIGPQGAPGNANVKTETFANRPFVLDSITNEYIIRLTIPSLNADIVARGLVDVSIKRSIKPNESWHKLPTVFLADTLALPPVPMQLRFKESTVEIYCTSNPGRLGLDARVTLVSGPFTP